MTASDPTTPGVSRRDLLLATAAAGAVAALLPRAVTAQVPATATPPSAPGTVAVRWLEGTAPAGLDAVTFTLPWPRGTRRDVENLTLRAGDAALTTESRPLAYWPDGSLKWTTHTSLLGGAKLDGLSVGPGTGPAGATLTVTELPDAVVVTTGPLKATVRKSGATFLDLDREGKPALKGARLVALSQAGPGPEDGAGAASREAFTSEVTAVTVEHKGTLRAVLKVEGTHKSESGRGVLPFVLRLYFHAGSDQVRVVHTFVYDLDPAKDFLAGVGLRFDVPLRGELYDRHVRFVGTGHGLFREAVRGITGLRRDPGKAVRDAQMAGKATPATDTWDRRVSSRLPLIPAWGDYTLSQTSADGFQIRKRTSPGHAWIPAAAGTRSGGVGYVGTPDGGVSFGVRDFWQKHPARLDLRNATADAAEVTLWLYSPDAPPMDLRFYHDGLGQDTYAKQREGLEITYEDYEPGYGTPYGIARTSELHLWATAATPEGEALVSFADAVRTPPALVCTPERYLEAKIFGGIWSLPDRSSPLKAGLEDRLAQALDQYVKEVEQRRWYGFWDYGDVMHSYDEDRHVWKYDIGGFAWDNSELSTDLWLWYSFMRTGRADVYRLAEAMTRHTSEVDTYHIGRFKFLGTRHGVQHFADSSKQTRISNAIYRRHYYFLTADERVGDLLRNQLQELETAKKIVVGRKLAADAPSLPLPPVENTPITAPVRIGPMEFGTLMGAWVSEAERTNDPAWHARVVTAMRTMAKVPGGFYASGVTIDLTTGEVHHDGQEQPGVSGLSGVFGLPEIAAEMHFTYGDAAPEFADVIGQYGRLYNTPADRQKELGVQFRTGAMADHHSRFLAFQAFVKKDPALAARAWRDYFGGPPKLGDLRRPQPLDGPDVLTPILELPMGTNGAAQWGLTTIQNLFYIGNDLAAAK